MSYSSLNIYRLCIELACQQGAVVIYVSEFVLFLKRFSVAKNMIRKRLKLLTGLIVLILFFAVYEFSSAFEAGTCEKGAENCDQPNGSPVLNAVEGVTSIVDEDGRFESDTEEDINILITFANAEGKTDFQNKFAVTVSSLFRFSSRHIVLYILGDKNSQEIAAQIIAKEVQDSSKYKVRIDNSF